MGLILFPLLVIAAAVASEICLRLIPLPARQDKQALNALAASLAWIWLATGFLVLYAHAAVHSCVESSNEGYGWDRTFPLLVQAWIVTGLALVAGLTSARVGLAWVLTSMIVVSRARRVRAAKLMRARRPGAPTGQGGQS
jgi:hypothetical protein